MNENLYTEACTIPSKGILNPEIPDGEVTLRCITLADQKFLAGSNLPGSQLVSEILKRCVVKPEGFDPYKLTSNDSMFLLFKLRILSYGGDYSFVTKCPECGNKMTVDIDLSKLSVDYLDPDYEDDMVVELPRNKDTVYTKLLTDGENLEVLKEAKRMSKKYRGGGDPAVTLKLARSISKIELKEANIAGDKVLTDPTDILSYVENLTDLDATAIMSVLAPEYGIQPSIDHVCPSCKEEVEVGIRFNPEFFRPKYDAKHRKSL